MLNNSFKNTNSIQIEIVKSSFLIATIFDGLEKLVAVEMISSLYRYRVMHVFWIVIFHVNTYLNTLYVVFRFLQKHMWFFLGCDDFTYFETIRIIIVGISVFFFSLGKIHKFKDKQISKQFANLFFIVVSSLC